VGQKNLHPFTGMTAHKGNDADVSFCQRSKNGSFARQGRHDPPMAWGSGPRANFNFIDAEIWDYTPQTVKIWNFAHKFAPGRRIEIEQFY